MKTLSSVRFTSAWGTWRNAPGTGGITRAWTGQHLASVTHSQEKIDPRRICEEKFIIMESSESRACGRERRHQPASRRFANVNRVDSTGQFGNHSRRRTSWVTHLKTSLTFDNATMRDKQSRPSSGCVCFASLHFKSSWLAVLNHQYCDVCAYRDIGDITCAYVDFLKASWQRLRCTLRPGSYNKAAMWCPEQ